MGRNTPFHIGGNTHTPTNSEENFLRGYHLKEIVS